MSPEDHKYYNQLLDTFSTPGWKLIVEKFKESADAKDSIRSIVDVDDFKERKGELKILDWIIRFEEEHRRTYDELSEEV